MRKIFYISLCCFLQLGAFSQGTDTLFVNFYHQTPFAYNDNGTLKGIEMDIINEYVLWLKAKKKISITLKHTSYTNHSDFFNSSKNPARDIIGLGSVTINSERAKDVDFTAPYLKDVAFCITNGHAPDVKAKTTDEITRTLGSMSALTINNTSLNRYILELKRQHLQDLKITYHTDAVKILDEISRNVLCFGYVDAVTFWFYLKNNPGKFLKMQKSLNQSREELGFILPKGSRHKALFDEFFSGPGGFKNTVNYRGILEKYLGSYMTQNMAVN